MDITNLEGIKEFITVDICFAGLYERFSNSLKTEYWKKLIPEEHYDFEKDESFIDFEDMLNFIEKYTPYTLFAIIPYNDSHYNKIKLIYTNK